MGAARPMGVARPIDGSSNHKSWKAEAGMRRKKTMAIGIASGLLCAACVLLYLQDVNGRAEAARTEALARYGGEQLEVCVAKRDIAAGESVDAAAIDTKLWVADLLPEDAVRSASDVVDRKATSSILAGEVISSKRFEETTASLDVPDGFSAVSVPARDVQAVGGAVAPGMSVDVYATGATSTDVIVREALVVSTSASGADAQGDGSVKWLTLAVSPDRVQELVAAAQSSELYFVLPGEGGDAAKAEGDER